MIGSGNTINIWHDNWIQGIPTLKLRVRLEEAEVEMVNDLFMPNSRSWNEQVIKNSFIRMDAEEILKLKAGVRLQEDVCAWAWEKHGSYSVRSAYRVLKADQMTRTQAGVERAMSSQDKYWWKVLWKMRIPPKVRIFWWRVLHNFLPSKAELKRRHVAKESHCEACGNPSETMFHIAVECTFALRFWEALERLSGSRLPRLHPASWAKDLMSGKMCLAEESSLFMCGVWSLRSGRNSRRHGKERWSAVAAACHIAKMVEDIMGLGAETTVSSGNEAKMDATGGGVDQGECRWCLLS